MKNLNTNLSLRPRFSVGSNLSEPYPNMRLTKKSNKLPEFNFWHVIPHSDAESLEILNQVQDDVIIFSQPQELLPITAEDDASASGEKKRVSSKLNNMHKTLILLLTLFLLPIATQAQYFNVFDIDTSDYPTMRAKFYSIDENGNQLLNHTPADFEITENGEQREVVDVSCPDPLPRPISVCIMVDTKKYINLARHGSERLVNFLDMPLNELGITAMMGSPQIIQDFTENKQKAREKSKSIPGAPGGTKVQEMFFAPYSGGIPFIKDRESQKKILILVSDLHCPNLSLEKQRLYQEAEEKDIKVYTVLLRTTDYTGLFGEIANNTGGDVFENVNDSTNIENIFLDILFREQNDPCEIVWESDYLCESKSINLDFHNRRTNKNFASMYNISEEKTANIIVEPSFINFGEVEPETSKIRTITITSKNIKVKINDIKLKNGSDVFKINESLPILLEKGETKEINVTFKPSDSLRYYSLFEIITDYCKMNISFLGGYFNKPISKRTLKLTHPNGGEVFYAGSDTVITWEGISNNETVKLEFSSDNGKEWNIISNNAKENELNWLVPDVKSDSCLIRVKQEKDGDSNNNYTLYDSIEKSNPQFNIFSWSPNGQYLAIYNKAKLLIYNLQAKEVVDTLSNFESTAGLSTIFEWSPNSQMIAAFYIDTTNTQENIKVWNFIDNSVTKLKQDGAYYLTWTPNSKELVIVGNSEIILWDIYKSIKTNAVTKIANRINDLKFTESNKILIRTLDSIYYWNFTTNDIIYKYKFSDSFSRRINLSHNKKRFTLGDKLFDVSTGERIDVIGYTAQFNRGVEGEFNFNDTKIAIGKQDLNIGQLGIYNLKNENIYNHSIRRDLFKFYYSKPFCWSLNSDKIAYGTDEKGLFIYNFNTKNIDFNIDKNNGINSVSWNPKFNYLASIGDDGLLKIWYLDYSPLQSDTSDAVFSIIAPEPRIQNNDIDLGKMVVGKTKDTMVVDILCNDGEAPLHVLGVDITSGDESEFLIPRGAGEFTLPQDSCQDFMFEFTPSEVGNRTAYATIRTTIGDFQDTIRIRGEGVLPRLEVETELINFGEVLVDNSKDSLVEGVITNTGSTTIDITGLEFAGPNKSDFFLTSGSTDTTFTLEPGGSSNFNFTFRPSDEGRTSCILEVKHKDQIAPVDIQLFGDGYFVPEFEILADTIDFGNVLVSETKDSLVEDIFKLISPMSFSSEGIKFKGQNPSNFFLTGGSLDTTFTLDHDDTFTTNLSFSPNRVGPFSAKLEFLYENLEEPLEVVLLGNGYIETNYFTMIEADNIEAESGDRVEFQLSISEMEIETEKAVPNWEAVLEYNGSIMHIDGESCGNDLICTKKISGTWDMESDELIKLQADIMLGNVEKDDIKIKEFKWLNDSLDTQIETRDGSLRILDICYEGGTRLINPNGKVSLDPLAPNMANNQTEIRFETIESGHTKLEIYNFLGSKVATIINGDIEPGRREMTLDLSDFATGRYYIQLSTPTVTKTEILEVVK